MRLATSEWGDPSGPAAVLLHGALGTRADWDFLRGATDHRWIAIDLPAHGESAVTASNGEWTFDAWSTALWSTRDALGCDDAVLVGYSMGGRLALQAAAAAPTRVRGVVALAATAGIASSEQAGRQKLDQQWAAEVSRASTDAERQTLLERWWSRPVFGNLCTHFRYQDLLAERAARPLAQSAPVLSTLGTGRMPQVDPQALPFPLHAVAGALDQKYVAEARKMAALAPAGTVEILPGLGHALLVEDPEKIAAIVGEQMNQMALGGNQLVEEVA